MGFFDGLAAIYIVHEVWLVGLVSYRASAGPVPFILHRTCVSTIAAFMIK